MALQETGQSKDLNVSSFLRRISLSYLTKIAPLNLSSTFFDGGLALEWPVLPNCKTFIWARIPQSSVLSGGHWELIRSAFLALRPPLDYSDKYFERLFQNIRRRKRGFTILLLVEVLACELRMSPLSVLTKRTAIAIASWILGKMVFQQG